MKRTADSRVLGAITLAVAGTVLVFSGVDAISVATIELVVGLTALAAPLGQALSPLSDSDQKGFAAVGHGLRRTMAINAAVLLALIVAIGCGGGIAALLIAAQFPIAALVVGRFGDIDAPKPTPKLRSIGLPLAAITLVALIVIQVALGGRLAVWVPLGLAAAFTVTLLTAGPAWPSQRITGEIPKV